MKRILSILIAILALASSAAAQSNNQFISVRDSATGAAVFNVGDTTNSAIRINCVTGCGGGTGGTASSYGSAFPSTGTAAGFSDGTNMQGARVADADTGAGTVYVLLQNLVRRASGGPVELIGQATMANSVPVVLASDQSTITTKLLTASSATTASVAGSASSVTVLASNANRLGATVYNDSTADLYLKFGATASTSSFVVKIGPQGYYPVEKGYTGVIDGIWTSAAGNARVTEW